MSDIKHTLQSTLFTPNGERLLGVVHLGKVSGKKKKSSFLCASTTIQRPVQVTISKVKKQDKGDQYKKQRFWDLKELKEINGRDNDSTEFYLTFEKNTTKWFASSVSEKQTFISALLKLCHRYLPRPQRPAFNNIPANLMEVSVANVENVPVPGPDDERIEDYQALTEQEEIDLEKMMGECEFAISDAEAFANSLSKDLSVLDGQNIHSIMGSEAQVNSLMMLLDNALDEVSKIEAQLDEYDLMVGGIASQMGQIKNQESFIQITNKNHVRLLEELGTIVMQLDLSKGHIKALRDGDLGSDSGIEACTSAADALQQAMEVDLPVGLSKLQAVAEQQKLFAELRQNFAKRLFDYLNGLFTKQGNTSVGGEALGVLMVAASVSLSVTSAAGTEIKLPKHFTFHRDLLPYRHLVLWLQKADKTKHTKLQTTYTSSLNKLYSKEISEFMASLKQWLMEQVAIDNEQMMTSSSSSSRGGLSKSEWKSSKLSLSRMSLNKKLSLSIKNLSGSQQSLHKDKKKMFGSTQSLAIKGIGKKLSLKKLKRGESKDSLSHGVSEQELSNWKKFSSTFREVLNELEPICQDEEIFLIKFFHLNVESIDTMMPGGSDDELDETEEGAAARKHYQEAQVTKEIRANQLWLMMTEIFKIVESELSELVKFGKELDPLNTLNMLVLIGQRVAHARQRSDGSFLAKMLGNCLIEVKRNFDGFIKNKVRVIEESHLSKGKKCGVLPFVVDFEEFVELSESIFRDSERRSDIDKAYKTLIQAVFIAIDRVATESQKTPPEVVVFENYHHLLNTLSSMKISALEQEKKDVKARYTSSVRGYVTSMLGRPLEKISNFFEGVEQVMESGVRAEEVGFQMKFSKQELRKCIKEYSGKDVKKGLESLYHKIEKHTAENDNRLQQVVWQHMQEEFIGQYKHFQDLIRRCYPDSDIKLEFTIENVLQYFSDIALSQKP